MNQRAETSSYLDRCISLLEDRKNKVFPNFKSSIFNLSTTKELPFNIPTDIGVDIEKITLKQNEIIKTHTHEQNEIIIVLSGKIQVLHPDCIETITEGNFILNKANLPHSFICLEDCQLLSLIFPPSRK